MFEFRLGSLLFKLLVLLALILGGYEYFGSLEELKAGIAEKKNLVEEIKGAVEARNTQRRELAALKSQMDEWLKREASAIQQADLLDRQERRLTGEIKFLAPSMRKAVEKARNTAVGTTMNELRLEGRSALLNAKILKVDDNSITFLHQDGVANLKLQADELPPDLIRQFDLGPAAVNKKLQRLFESIAQAPGQN